MGLVWLPEPDLEAALSYRDRLSLMDASAAVVFDANNPSAGCITWRQAPEENS